ASPRQVRREGTQEKPAVDRFADDEASTEAGRPAVRDVRTVAADTGPRRDADDKPVRGETGGRAGPGGGRYLVPGPATAIDRRAADESILPNRHEAGRNDRDRRFQIDRRRRGS